MEFLLLCILSSILIKNLGLARNTPNIIKNIHSKLDHFDKTLNYINRNEAFCNEPSLTHEKQIYCDLYEIQKNFQTAEEQLKRVSLFLLENKKPIHNMYTVESAVSDIEEYELDDNGDTYNENEIGRYEYDPNEG